MLIIKTDNIIHKYEFSFNLGTGTSINMKKEKSGSVSDRTPKAYENVGT